MSDRRWQARGRVSARPGARRHRTVYFPVMSDDDSWIVDWEGLCVSLVRPLSPEEAAKSIALADFHSFEDRRAAETWVEQSATYDTSWFATGEIDGWTFLWEANGWQGVTPEKAIRLAGSGVLYSIFWNVNSQMTFLAVEDAMVIRQFDPVFHDQATPPTAEVGARLAAEAELDWEGTPRTSGLSLLASLTGVAPIEPLCLVASDVRFWGHRF